MGTLCNSIKQIKAPYVFDWDPEIAVHAMQGNCASALTEGDVSWFFSCCGENLGYILELWLGWRFNTRVSSAMSGFLCSYDRYLRNLNQACRDNTDASKSEE